jgi:hypothetical protein
MKDLIVVGSMAVAVLGLFMLAMGNPLMFLCCMLPIFIVSQT